MKEISNIRALHLYKKVLNEAKGDKKLTHSDFKNWCDKITYTKEEAVLKGISVNILNVFPSVQERIELFSVLNAKTFPSTMICVGRIMMNIEKQAPLDILVFPELEIANKPEKIQKMLYLHECAHLIDNGKENMKTLFPDEFELLSMLKRTIKDCLDHHIEYIADLFAAVSINATESDVIEYYDAVQASMLRAKKLRGLKYIITDHHFDSLARRRKTTLGVITYVNQQNSE